MYLRTFCARRQTTSLALLYLKVGHHHLLCTKSRTHTQTVQTRHDRLNEADVNMKWRRCVRLFARVFGQTRPTSRLTGTACQCLWNRRDWSAIGLSTRRSGTARLVHTNTCFNTLRTGLLNCLNARSRGLTFRHRASCI